MLKEPMTYRKAVDDLWSNYCDLDHWIEEMARKPGVPSKYVLKMAMKHLRSDLYNVHKFICKLKDIAEVNNG